jgi:hypothetical protein
VLSIESVLFPSPSLPYFALTLTLLNESCVVLAESLASQPDRDQTDDQTSDQSMTSSKSVKQTSPSPSLVNVRVDEDEADGNIIEPVLKEKTPRRTSRIIKINESADFTSLTPKKRKRVDSTTLATDNNKRLAKKIKNEKPCDEDEYVDVDHVDPDETGLMDGPHTTTSIESATTTTVNLLAQNLPDGCTNIDFELFKLAQQNVKDKILKMNSNNKNKSNDVNPCAKPNQLPRLPAYIRFGKFLIETWYSAPYPQEYVCQSTLHICEFCLKYMRTYEILQMHLKKCLLMHPPGM